MKPNVLFLMYLLAIASLFFYASCHPPKPEINLDSEPGSDIKSEPGSDINSEITPEKLRIAIQSMTFDTDKVEHIRNYKDSVTDDIKLLMITNILTEFTHDRQALLALELLSHKISKNYSEEDLKAFINIFTFSDSKTEAMRLLNQ